MGHEPVLATSVCEWLVREPDGLYIDGTVGCGGHARRILECLGAEGSLWGFDWDEEMLETARSELNNETQRVRLFHDPFSRVGDRLEEEGVRAHGIFLDLGLNSAVLDSTERGFRYRDADSPLDMRMDRRKKQTAADLLNKATEPELTTLFRDLGGVRRAGAVARALVQARERSPLRFAGDLVAALRRGRGSRVDASELSRIYQALRVKINEELEDLDRFLETVVDALLPAGRLLVLSYESVTDRRVKRMHAPITPDHPAPFRLLTRRVIQPDREEIRANPRARSAKLRAMERTV